MKKLMNKFNLWKWNRFHGKKLHWPLVRRTTWRKEAESLYRANKQIAELIEANDKERDRLAELIAKFMRVQLETPSHTNNQFYLKIEIAPEIFYNVYNQGERDPMRYFAKYAAYALEREIMKIEIRQR